MKTVIVITGPTGVGKTKLSIEIAKKYGGEIINADAMQVYQGLDIGTAKITTEEKEEIPHHLFDIKNVTEDYSIYHYQKDCRNKIQEIFSRNKMPILVGGTGLYIKSALYDYQLTPIKNKNNDSYENINTEELYQKLIQLDPKIVGKIDQRNRRRIINAIEYYQENHKSISTNKTNKLLYHTIFIGLTTKRENLYQIINNRVDRMIASGLEKEVYAFYQKKIFTKPLLAGIGYKELYQYFNYEITLNEAIELIKRNSRRYAKRQYTYFKHQLPIMWFETNYQDFFQTVHTVCDYIDQQLIL